MLTNVVAERGLLSANITIKIGANRDIYMVVGNLSESSAENITIDFISRINPTNILASEWGNEPPEGGQYHWRMVAKDSQGQYEGWTPQAIHIQTSYKNIPFVAEFEIHADRSKTKIYTVWFTFE